MIITLKGANFSASNIGTLSTWRVYRTLGAGAAYSGATMVDKNASFSATVIISTGYEIADPGVSVTMGGNTVSTITVNENIVTINIAAVTGDIIINVPTTQVNNQHTHNYSASTTKQPTCDVDGIETYICSCGHTYTAVIPATGHNYMNGNCIKCGKADPSYIVLTKISAVYNGDNVPTNTLVDELKNNLIVTAHYSDGSSVALDANSYTISGEILEGENIITIQYDTFTTTLVVIGTVQLVQLITTHDGTAMDVGSNINDIEGLGVMAVWSNGLTELITDYTLTGNNGNTIVEGNNPITITYNNISTVINVNGVGEIDANAVDLVLFTGQSNMSGRGTAVDAPVVPEGQGYWYKDPSLPNMSKDTAGLYNISEPFGLESLCTGSMVSQFATSYYKQTRYPIVACAGAIGGTDLALFTKNGGNIWGPYISTSVQGAKNYLESIGKRIRRAFVVFNQGENDAQHNNSKEQYMATFNQFWTDLKTDFGFEEMFVIGLGQYNGTSNIDFTDIKAAHLELAENNDDITFVSDKFTGATTYMRDEWHYTQVVYNAVGKDAATNIVNYYNGIEPTITQFTGLDTSTEPILTVGSLDDWDYEIIGSTVRLKQYIGTNTDVFVHAYYALNGQIYSSLVPAVETKTSSGTTVPVDETVAAFAKNTTITSVTFEDNVRLENNNANCLFYGCTALKRVHNIPNAAKGAASLCYGCTSLVDYPTFAKYSGTLNQAFRNCQQLVADATTIVFPPNAVKFGNMFRDCKKITSVPNIPAAAEEITAMFQGCTGLITAGDVTLGKGTLATSVFYGCTSLKTVGKIYGDTITSIASLFQNCKALEGTVRIECPNITTVTNAFSSVDLTKITIEVPAGSKTQEAIAAAYPAANIVTF